MGGGIWTSVSLPLTRATGPTVWPMLGITAVGTLAWLASWHFYFKPKVFPRMREEWKIKERAFRRAGNGTGEESEEQLVGDYNALDSESTGLLSSPIGDYGSGKASSVQQ